MILHEIKPSQMRQRTGINEAVLTMEESRLGVELLRKVTSEVQDLEIEKTLG